MNGMAASRSETVSDDREASSHIRIPTRTRRSEPRSSSPSSTSSPTSRYVVGTGMSARRATAATGRLA
jgi:hypothetical protein